MPVNENMFNLVKKEQSKRTNKNHGLSWLLRFGLLEDKGIIKRKEKDLNLKWG